MTQWSRSRLMQGPLSLKSRMSKLALSILTIVLGAIPATYLFLFALLAVVLGGSVMLDGSIVVGAAFLVFGIAACYGTVSLWAIGFREITPTTKFGLLAGLIALVAGLALNYAPKDLSVMFGSKFFVVALGPFVVASCWLISFVVRQLATRRRRKAAH
jgi:hypothetical protein